MPRSSVSTRALHLRSSRGTVRTHTTCIFQWSVRNSRISLNGAPDNLGASRHLCRNLRHALSRGSERKQVGRDPEATKHRAKKERCPQRSWNRLDCTHHDAIAALSSGLSSALVALELLWPADHPNRVELCPVTHHLAFSCWPRAALRGCGLRKQQHTHGKTARCSASRGSAPRGRVCRAAPLAARKGLGCALGTALRAGESREQNKGGGLSKSTLLRCRP